MPREVDERKKRKALRKLRRAAALAQEGLGPPLSNWERTFLEEVEARVETYGSAFADPEKGAQDEPLSALQALKLREIDKKSRGRALGRPASGFGNRSRPLSGRQSDAELSTEAQAQEETAPVPHFGLSLIPARDLADRPEPQQPRRSRPRPALRVIKGGAAPD